MAQRGVYFNGRWITHPGAYATIDANNMTAMSSGSPKIVALVGPSKGGVPGEIMWFSNPSDAKRVLKGGYLLKAAQKAWSPVKGGGGAYLIACVRVNHATRSELTMGDGTPTVAKIGAVETDTTNESTGTITVSGTYTGNTDEVLEVLVDSEGTQPLAKVTFSYKIGGKNWTATKSDLAQKGSSIPLADGIKLTFGDGNYTSGSLYRISLHAAKSERIGARITSKDYGDWTKKVQVKLENGDLKGTKKLTAYYWEEDKYEIFRDLGAALYFKYTGAEPYAELFIEHNDEGKAVKLYTKIGKDEKSAIEDINVDLTETRFHRIVDLADYLSGFSSYTCRYHPTVRHSISGTDLDAIKADITKETLVTAVWKDISLAITENSDLMNVTLEDNLAKLPDNFGYTNLKGGSDGEIPTSWIPYFDKLGAHPVNFVVPLTGDAGIHAEARANAVYLSDTLGRERTVKIGGYTGESLDEIKKRAISHNNDRVQLAYPGFYDYNDAGELELYPSFITAAMLAGRDAFLPVGESATFDCFDVITLEKELQPQEVSDLLNSGVATLEYVINKGCRLVQDITSYTQDSRSLYCERSVRDLADNLNKELREKIEETVVGNKGIFTNVESTKNLVIGFLQQKIRDEIIVAYRNVRVTFVNKVIFIEYEAAPVEPTNYALIKGHFYTADEIKG